MIELQILVLMIFSKRGSGQRIRRIKMVLRALATLLGEAKVLAKLY